MAYIYSLPLCLPELPPYLTSKAPRLDVLHPSILRKFTLIFEMGITRSEHFQANCEITWGKGDYDINIETDDYETFWAVLRKEFDNELGPVLTITGLCDSPEHTLAELDRMLFALAKQVQSGQPMTKEESLDIFGGPKGQNKPILKIFMAEMDARVKEAEEKQTNRQGRLGTD